jgi:predicted RNase H-like HicB family nuclease
MIIASVRRADGAWVRRAEYPELPGCIAEADSPLDAIDQLDLLREAIILGRLARGEPVPVPRSPLARLVRPTQDSPMPIGREVPKLREV